MSTPVEAPIQRSDPGATSTPALRWAALALIAITWASAAIFGVYILAFYGGAVPGHEMGRWNATLPRLYEPHRPLSTTAMGLHFAAGGVLLLLGPVQLIGPIRRRWRAFHRWTGRLYASASLSAGLGGLFFIASKGTVGGAPMTTGFGLYGVLAALVLTGAAAFLLLGTYYFTVYYWWPGILGRPPG